MTSGKRSRYASGRLHHPVAAVEVAVERRPARSRAAPSSAATAAPCAAPISRSTRPPGASSRGSPAAMRAVGLQPGRPRRQRVPRLPVAHVRGERRDLGRGDVGRVRHHEVEALLQPLGPVGRARSAPAPPPRAARHSRAATASAAASMSVPRPRAAGHSASRRDEDRAAAGAEVEDRRRRRPGQRRAPPASRSPGRGSSTARGDHELAPPEQPPPDDLRHRPEPRALADHPLERVRSRRRQRLGGGERHAGRARTPSAAAISRRASRAGVGHAGGRERRRGARQRRPGRSRSRVEVGEPRRLVGGGERRQHLVEVALHHLVELVERQADAMVGQPALREVVGADPLRPVAAADLALAVRRPRRVAPRRARGRRAARAAPASPAPGSGAATSPRRSPRCRSAGG